MKKALLVAAIVLVVFASTAGAQDIGIGVEYVFNFSGSVLNGLAITGSPPVLPMVFGLSFAFGGGVFHFGVTADWWLYQTTLTGPLALYVGPGLYFGVGGGILSLGARVPVGLQFWVIPPLELFLEVAPSVGVSFGGGTVAPRFGIGAALGGRFWF